MTKQSKTEPPRYITTGQAADFCGVNLRTIIRWIEKGILKAHKLPLRGDHRIETRDFVQFLNENDLPVPSLYKPLNDVVMIVDDRKEDRELLKLILSKHEVETVEAQNGMEAGTMLELHFPRLILLDMIMPGMDGFSVMSFLRSHSRYKDIEVIIITSIALDKIPQEIKNEVKGIITKPAKPDELISLVQQCLPSLGAR